MELTGNEVWCPLCRVNFEALGPGSVTEFCPQGVSVEPDGSLTFSHRHETYMDYNHLACGTKVRFDMTGAYQELDVPYEHMVEVDLPGGDSPALLLGPDIVTCPSYLGHVSMELALDDEMHRELVKTREVLRRLRDAALDNVHIKEGDPFT